MDASFLFSISCCTSGPLSDFLFTGVGLCTTLWSQFVSLPVSVESTGNKWFRYRVFSIPFSDLTLNTGISCLGWDITSYRSSSNLSAILCLPSNANIFTKTLSPTFIFAALDFLSNWCFCFNLALSECCITSSCVVFKRFLRSSKYSKVVLLLELSIAVSKTESIGSFGLLPNISSNGETLVDMPGAVICID